MIAIPAEGIVVAAVLAGVALAGVLAMAAAQGVWRELHPKPVPWPQSVPCDDGSGDMIVSKQRIDGDSVWKEGANEHGEALVTRYVLTVTPATPHVPARRVLKRAYP